MEQSYAGKTAVITGAARGFGLAFGRALAERGAHVVLVDIDEPAVQEAAAGAGVPSALVTTAPGAVMAAAAGAGRAPKHCSTTPSFTAAAAAGRA